MTTNRMGLEQTLSDVELTQIVSGCVDGVYPTSQEVSMARELLAYRKASKKAVADVVAWNKPGEERKCDIRWRRFDVAPGPLFAVPPLHAVTVPDDMRNRLKAEGIAELLRDALGYAPLTSKQWEMLANNWHQTFIGLSGDATLKSVTNEP